RQLEEYAERIADDSILPQQFYQLWHEASERSGEHCLMVAILQDALQCWFASDAIGAGAYGSWDCLPAKRRRLHNEADRWLFDSKARAPVTFEMVCAVLDLDQDWIRRKLREVAKLINGPQNREQVQTPELRLIASEVQHRSVCGIG